MGALKIDCYCNEKQMGKIIDMVAAHLYDSDRGDVADFDDVIDDMRICAQFDTYMDVVNLRISEVLDSDWDLLYEDTAVFTSRLRAILNDYNRNGKESGCQAHHVLADRWDEL
ncbi:hypothetical protein M2451_002794 [Dysgonomonas sp. PFB1-18]|uniref:hypothetical protein n=1 Tax=unclassified Dysgonomonas TaxID=2630389 RepID=UPI0024730556|nr:MULTISPECIES: hypothetical protein [unclassified Dysgonomonas]MDH6309320.1 hypothetical protein [Dysgonomonas sp. PF1-14]MDH6339815.1 hypothetical protein [Dysgonomonas sp. PF1-16]MDH6381463.1 hypothetical protein [Dysgonomonas sp. PFB1-18]MDH6398678.1 hypothetical protein [Dysgonomonas sp. PF1-23]